MIKIMGKGLCGWFRLFFVSKLFSYGSPVSSFDFIQGAVENLTNQINTSKNIATIMDKDLLKPSSYC